MLGTPYFKWIYGQWDHLGYLTTENLPIPNGVVLSKGTWVNQMPGADDTKCQLASGDGKAIGVTLQDIDNEGLSNLETLKKRIIGGNFDYPLTKGHAVSIRVPRVGAQMEFEGLGEAEPGNLVCTEGTGAIDDETPVDTLLSFLNGCIRVAQAGEFAQLLLKHAGLTPEIEGNLRIRVEYISPIITPESEG